MRYYIYGKNNKKTFLLLPGTCCNVKSNFSQVIPLLAKHFCVIGVDYDGFDGSGREFTSMTDIMRKIEHFVINKLGGNIDIVYGSSLGGSFVGLLHSSLSLPTINLYSFLTSMPPISNRKLIC